MKNQESYLDGFPGIELVNKEGRLAIGINGNALPAHCQYKLVEEAVNLLEKTPDCEKPEELEQALRTYLTTTKKPINDTEIWDTWRGRVIACIGVLVSAYIYLYVTEIVLSAISLSALGTAIGIAVGLGIFIGAIIVAVGAGMLCAGIGIGLTLWLSNRGMNTVKSKQQLEDLIQAINPSLEQASQNVAQEPQSQASQPAANVVIPLPEASNSRRSSASFFPDGEFNKNEDPLAAQASNGECSGVAHVMSQGRH